MSSHHFVREEQAACLYVIDKHIDYDILVQLLEWNPKIIATEQGFNWLHSYGIKADVIISNAPTQFEVPYIFEHWETNSDEEILKVIYKKIKSARITMVGSKEVQHIHKIMLRNPEFNLTLFESKKKHFLIKKNVVFKKWVNKNFRCNIYPEQNAIIEKNLNKTEDGYLAHKDGLVIINSFDNLIVTESI